MFTKDKKVQKQFQSDTSSGSMVMNDAVVHLSVETLPFGGRNKIYILIEFYYEIHAQVWVRVVWGTTTADIPFSHSLMKNQFWFEISAN